MAQKKPGSHTEQRDKPTLITDWHELPTTVQASFNDCAAITAPRKRKAKQANANAA